MKGWTAAVRVGAAPRDVFEKTDQVVRDLDIPIMNQALGIQDTIFAVADDLGMGEEARQLVYALRTYEYASKIAAGVVPAGSVAASSAVFASVSGVAALGAIGAVAAIFSLVFGGDEGEEFAKRQQKALLVAHSLASRLAMLTDFAKEQESQAKKFKLDAQIAPVQKKDPAPFLAAAAQKERLSKLYRALDKRMRPADRELLISLSNLGRWEATLEEYSRPLSTKQYDPWTLGQVPAVLSQIAARIAKERDSLEQLAKKAPRRPQGRVAVSPSRSGSGLLLYAAIGAGAALLFPTQAGALYSRAAGLASRLLSKVRL